MDKQNGDVNQLIIVLIINWKGQKSLRDKVTSIDSKKVLLS